MTRTRKISEVMQRTLTEADGWVMAKRVLMVFVFTAEAPLVGSVSICGKTVVLIPTRLGVYQKW